MPKFWLVPLHKMLALATCTFVDWLRKLPSKEQQLSRTQHFILSSHATLFGLHTIRPMQNTADPYDTTTELSLINALYPEQILSSDDFL